MSHKSIDYQAHYRIAGLPLNLNSKDSVMDELNDDQLKRLLERLESVISAIPTQKEWLRTGDVADYLNISTSQVHVLKNEGILPFSKLHGSLYFKRSDIDKLLEEKMSTQ